MHLPGAYLGEISAMVADGRRTFLIWQVEELGLLADRDDQGVLLQVSPRSMGTFIEICGEAASPCTSVHVCSRATGRGDSISIFSRGRA